MPKNLKMSLLLDFYAPVLTENQREVINLYYNEDLSLAEIANESGITRQGVRDSIKRGETIMTELEEKLHFASWYEQHSSTSRAIRTDVAEIVECNARGGLAKKIKETADRIIARLDELDNTQE